MITYNRYDVYRYPSSAEDHRPVIAGLALGFLAIALMALVYLFSMAMQNQQNANVLPIEQGAVNRSISHAPVFINTALRH